MFDAVTALQLMHLDAVFKHFDGDSSNFFNLQTCLGGATVRAEGCATCTKGPQRQARTVI
jgi:hypothetical protein